MTIDLSAIRKRLDPSTSHTEFLVHAPEDLRALLSRVEELERRNVILVSDLVNAMRATMSSFRRSAELEAALRHEKMQRHVFNCTSDPVTGACTCHVGVAAAALKGGG